MPEFPSCATCRHLPHPDRACRVKRVDGPPATNGKAVGEGYDHGDRTVTECGCDTYQPELNGDGTFFDQLAEVEQLVDQANQKETP